MLFCANALFADELFLLADLESAESTEALLEGFNASAGINDLLLTSVERVALGADVDVKIMTDSAADLKSITARALDVHFFVLRMDILFHLDL